MARLPVLPDPAKTVHFLGDVHAGAITQQRLDKVTRDLNKLHMPTPAARIQVGDSVDAGTSDSIASAFFGSFTDGAPLRVVPGNHDTHGIRTRAAAATALGTTATPWTLDLSFVRLIGIGDVDSTNANSDSNNMYVPSSDLTYLDNALAGTSLPCWIVGHAPLKNTVTGPTSGDNAQWSSAETLFFMHGASASSADSSDITTVLAAHSNAKAWFCDHTHSDVNTPGLVTTLSLGGHNVAHVNCPGAIYYTGRTLEWTDPLRSLYATLNSAGNIELRIRDHGAGSWVQIGIQGSRVTTVTL